MFDGAGEVVPDALIESWQASPEGRFDHPDDPRGAAPGFRGFGRCPTDASGEWGIRTVLPGRVPGTDGVLQAPHIDLSVFARGLLDRVVTRVYFPAEPSNVDDPVLSSVPDRGHAGGRARAGRVPVRHPCCRASVRQSSSVSSGGVSWQGAGRTSCSRSSAGWR